MSLGTLYSNGNLCPFAHRVQIAAAELSADISVVFDGDIPAAVREATRPGSWPAFAPPDGGDLLHDSEKIVNHLVAASGAAGESYRSDPEILAKLNTLVMCITKVILDGEPAIQKEFRDTLDRALAEVEFVRSASNGPYLEGEHFSQADGHIAPFLYRLPFLVEIRDHVPQIFLANDGFNAWVDRVVNRKSFQQIAPKRHAVRQFYAAKASYGKPMKVGWLHHSGLRAMWEDVVSRTSAIASGEDRGNHDLQEARDLCYLLFRAVASHARFENVLLFPALDTAKDDPAFTAEAVGQHEHEEEDLNSLLEHFDRALGEVPGARHQTLRDLASACERLRESQFEHFDFEEANFVSVLSDLEIERHLDMLEGAYEMCILGRPELIGALAAYMPIENTLSLLDSLQHAVKPDSERWRLLLVEMHRTMCAEKWLRVVRRFEDSLPASLMVVPSSHRRKSIGSAARELHAAFPVDRIEIPETPVADRNEMPAKTHRSRR